MNTLIFLSLVPLALYFAALTAARRTYRRSLGRYGQTRAYQASVLLSWAFFALTVGLLLTAVVAGLLK